MNSKLKKIWNTSATVFIALIAALALLLVGARLFGVRIYTVLSGSMEPTYMTGSVIFVKKTDPMKLKEGDVITFLLADNKTATHRIVEVLEDEEDPQVRRFRTKGDANDSPDGSPVHCNNVVGTPFFTIEKIGYFIEGVKTPPGSFIAIGLAALLLLLLFVPEILGSEKKKPTDETADA